MATKAAPNIKEFAEDSLEKKVYTIVDSLEDHLPLMNDRNRLSFALLNYLRGEGDAPSITVRNNKLSLRNIDQVGLAKLLESKLKDIK